MELGCCNNPSAKSLTYGTSVLFKQKTLQGSNQNKQTCSWGCLLLETPFVCRKKHTHTVDGRNPLRHHPGTPDIMILPVNATNIGFPWFQSGAGFHPSTVSPHPHLQRPLHTSGQNISARARLRPAKRAKNPRATPARVALVQAAARHGERGKAKCWRPENERTS